MLGIAYSPEALNNVQVNIVLGDVFENTGVGGSRVQTGERRVSVARNVSKLVANA